MVREIFVRFLLLGLTAFGGPMAHLALFRRVFVEKLQWLDEAGLAELIALCQALPGPASSQVAMAIGYRQGGWKGFFAAWTGFSLPPVTLMILFAAGTLRLEEGVRLELVHGVKVAVVAVVALALWKMSRSLLTGPAGWATAAALTGVFVLFPSPWVFVLLLLLAGLLAYRRQSPGPPLHRPGSLLRQGRHPLLLALPGVFLAFFLLGLFPATWAAIPGVFYQTGLVVFGGGHVVLPLLERFLVEPGLISGETFLFGYGLAQVIPGPLFSFSAFVGAAMGTGPQGELLLGLLAFISIYLPSFFLLGFILPRWNKATVAQRWKKVLAGVHPVVIGLLAATWIHPVMTAGIGSPFDLLLAAAALPVLARFPAWTLPTLAATAAIGTLLPS